MNIEIPATLVFATHNAHKVAEVQRMMPGGFRVVSLSEIGWTAEIEEPWFTLEENALEKARIVQQMTGQICFAEDSGLLVEALDGKPGVFSKRFAGNMATDDENIDKLLHDMERQHHRTAHFKTVIAFMDSNGHQLFEGICPGKIINEKRGSNGFGYDPLFIPDGSTKTFGEMDAAEKGEFSHRGKAVREFLQFLTTYSIQS